MLEPPHRHPRGQGREQDMVKHPPATIHHPVNPTAQLPFKTTRFPLFHSLSTPACRLQPSASLVPVVAGRCWRAPGVCSCSSTEDMRVESEIRWRSARSREVFVLMNSQGMQHSRGRNEAVNCRCVRDGRKCKREQWWRCGHQECVKSVHTEAQAGLREDESNAQVSRVW